MAPLGLPAPLRLAAVAVMLLAALVTAVGAPEVVTESTAPNAVPSVLATIAQ